MRNPLEHCVIAPAVEAVEAAERRTPRIGTVAATIAILRLLASERRGMGVNAIARQLNQSPSSCFNILKTLMSEEFVEFDSQAKLYTLGDGVIEIARSALDPTSTFDMIRNRVEPLAEKWAATVGLWRVRNNRIILVGYVPGSQTMRIHLAVGQRLPLLMGSVGRCIAAVRGLDGDEIVKRFEELRWQQAPALSDYIEDVAAARAHGWSIDRGYFVRGATTLATPLFQSDGDMRFCLAVTMFTGQYPDEQLPVLAEEMKGIARWASSRLVAA